MISSDEEQKRRKKFAELIIKLNIRDISSDSGLRGELYTDIRYIYTGNSGNIDFRHYYSDVFQKLIQLNQDRQDITLIGHNLQLLYDFSVKKKEYGIAECIKKLYDHVNLETARITYLNGIEAHEIKPEEVRGMLDDVGNQITIQGEKVNRIIKHTDDAYSNFIAILGIFSAIVMVFFGGTTVFTKVLGDVSKTPIDKMILICTLCGLIIFDIIFMFLYFLSKLLDRNISATSEYVYWKDIVSRFRMRYPIIFYTNLIGSVVILCSGFSMLLKIVLEMKVNDSTVNKVACDYIFKFIQGNRAFCIALAVLIVFNVLFSVVYLIAKLTDVNIGCRLILDGKYPFWWNFDEDNKFVVYKYDTRIADFNNENEMQKFLKRKNMWANLKAPVCNFAKRAFCRYPYFSIINFMLLVVLIYIKYGV